MDFKLCTIDGNYIEFLRNDIKLRNVFENKDDADFPRKYLGIVFNINEYYYYAPLSSPKRSDYKLVNGIECIRPDILTIIRIPVEENGELKLKGTLKLSNMIPVSSNMITFYNIDEEEDYGYKSLVSKEYEVLKRKKSKILKNAKMLYHQKTHENEIFTEKPKPGYLAATIDFKYAEQMHDKYIEEHSSPCE